MANRRQIPFLHWTAAGVAHWKPSPRLRAMGWTNRKLGTRDDETAVIMAALALNKEVEEFQGHALAAPVAPRRRTVGDAIAEYYRSDDFAKGLADSTQREYRVRLNFIQEWALDGKLPLDQLDRTMVRDLKTALLAGDASLHRANAIMRVLRLLLNWTIRQGWLVSNPTDGIRMRQAPPRDTVLLEDQIAAVQDAATATGLPRIALGFLLGLWSLQRRSDLLKLTKLSWRVIDNVAPADRAVLAGSNGEVMGFRLRQTKTGAWVDCPMPPFLHADIETAFRTSQWLLADDKDLARPYPAYLFTRRARTVLDAAGLDDSQFRDLRRSGMTMLRDYGCEAPGITAISGHMILGRKSILDTYMPGNTRAACAAMAHALRTRTARTARKDQSE